MPLFRAGDPRGSERVPSFEGIFFESGSAPALTGRGGFSFGGSAIHELFESNPRVCAFRLQHPGIDYRTPWQLDLEPVALIRLLRQREPGSALREIDNLTLNLPDANHGSGDIRPSLMHAALLQMHRC